MKTIEDKYSAVFETTQVTTNMDRPPCALIEKEQSTTPITVSARHQ